MEQGMRLSRGIMMDVVATALMVVSLFQGTMLGRCPLRTSSAAPGSLVRSRELKHPVCSQSQY